MWLGELSLMVELPKTEFRLGFISLLTLVFITLKLTHQISWSVVVDIVSPINLWDTSIDFHRYLLDCCGALCVWC